MYNIDMESLDLEKTYDLIVLGGGPTAIACAIYAARFALDVLIVGKIFGGLIATTDIVENYPGITSTSGQGLMEMFKEKGIADKLVLVGGNIPRKDIEILEGYGITGVFPVGSKLDEIVRFIQERIKRENEKT